MKKYISLACLLLAVVMACKKNGDAPGLVVKAFSPVNGAKGLEVTITGGKFDTGISNINVCFNSTPAHILQANDSVLLVVVPPAATTGKISVTVKGRTGYSAKDFVILPGDWVKKSPLPYDNGRALCYSFNINGKEYIGGGLIGLQTGLNKDLWEYDPATDNWTQKTGLNFPLASAVSMVINNKGYVGIGETYSIANGYQASNVFFEYDPVTDKWAQKADFPGDTRTRAIGLAMGGKGYAGFGLLGTSFTMRDYTSTNDWWEYNPANNTWLQKKSAPMTMLDPTGFVLNDMLYAGVTSGAQGFYQYNPATDSWAKKSDFPGAYPSGMCTFIINGNVYVAGGENGCWQYDVQADKWVQKAFFSNNINDGVTFSFGNKGYYVTGFDKYAFAHSELWEFTP